MTCFQEKRGDQETYYKTKLWKHFFSHPIKSIIYQPNPYSENGVG